MDFDKIVLWLNHVTIVKFSSLFNNGFISDFGCSISDLFLFRMPEFRFRNFDFGFIANWDLSMFLIETRLHFQVHCCHQIGYGTFISRGAKIAVVGRFRSVEFIGQKFVAFPGIICTYG
jgi:hypothetical protein